MQRFFVLFITLVCVSSCGGTRPPPPAVDYSLAPTSAADAPPAQHQGELPSANAAAAVSIRADIWADNWFALFVDETLIGEDSVSITTERSFNSEVFSFAATYPVHINVILKDYIQDDTGLEYIGTDRQQIGDGGFIAQFTDTATGSIIAVTDRSWKCVPIHIAPRDAACAAQAQPIAGEGACTNTMKAEPNGWKSPSFDDATWPAATIYSARDVGPKDGYDAISWDPSARFIWGPDLKTNNTVLCRVTIQAP